MVGAQLPENAVKPISCFGFVVCVTFLQGGDALAADLLQLLIDIFSRFAEKRVRGVA